MRRALSVGLGLLLVLGATPSASAAPGDLDPSFSDDGILLPRQQVSDVAFAPDGKAVTLTGERSNCASGSCDQARVFRYTKSGKRDPNFGGGDGQIDLPGPGPGGYFWPSDVLVQPDGKILVSGRANSRPIVMRFNTNGALDRSFAKRGKFWWQYVGPSGCQGNFGSGDELGLDSLGRVYVMSGVGGWGDCEQAYGDPYVPWVFRVSKAGALDTSYGPLGRVLLRCAPGVTTWISDFEIMPNDRLLAGGGHADIPDFEVETQLGECVIRVRASGVRDGSFGDDGVATSLDWGVIDDIEVGTGGVIDVLGGSSGNQRIARLDGTGAPEWNRSIGPDAIIDMELQGTKILIIGAPDWTVRRYKADGSPDLPFGEGDGTLSTTFDGTVGNPLDGAILGKRLVVVGGADRATTLGAGAAYLLGA